MPADKRAGLQGCRVVGELVDDPIQDLLRLVINAALSHDVSSADVDELDVSDAL